MTCDFCEVTLNSEDLTGGLQLRAKKKPTVFYTTLKRIEEKTKNLIVHPLIPFLVMNYSHISVIDFVWGVLSLVKSKTNMSIITRYYSNTYYLHTFVYLSLYYLPGF